MSFFDRFNALYAKPDLTYDLNGQSAVIFSDGHYGDAGPSDDADPNRGIIENALLCYTAKKFLRISAGDTTEDWQSKRKDIDREYRYILALFDIFLDGNHDAERKHPQALLLKFGDKEMFILHGHQGFDLLNDKLWFIGKFFTRWIWRPLEYIGIRNWTSASKNLKRHDYVRKLHLQWASDHPNTILGCGHLHGLENVGNYWNFGTATIPGQVDCVELEGDVLRLVRWTKDGRECI